MHKLYRKMEKYLHFWVIHMLAFISWQHLVESLSYQTCKNCLVKHLLPQTPKVFLSDTISNRSAKENYNIKMKATKIQRKTSAPMVPVRAHLFTSHAYVSPLSLLAM